MIVIKDLSRKAETLILNALCNIPEVIRVLIYKIMYCYIIENISC
jgi:hypothetical protein